jgi:hypothetical protein
MPTGEGCLNLCGRGDGFTVALTPEGADRFIELIPNVKEPYQPLRHASVFLAPVFTACE